MRKLILFFLLLAGTAYGQSNNTTNTKFTNGLAVPNGATQKPTSGLTAGALSYVTGAGLYVYNGTSWELLGLSSGGVTSFNGRTGVVVPLIGDYSSFYTPLTRSLTINGATQTLAADRTWTITANTPNSLTAGYGLTGGVFDGSVARTYAADTLSVNGLVSKLRLATNLAGYVKKATTITINGVTQDLSDNRIWTAGTVTSITPGYGLTPQTAITSTGGFAVDTLVLDTVYAKIGSAPTISFGTFGSTPNAQGGSYSGGVITLGPADATNPGGVSTTTQTIKGNKTIINDADAKNTLLTLRNNVNGNDASSAFKIESNGDNYLEFNVNSSIWDGGAYGGQTYMQANGGALNISATLSGSNVPVKITKPSVLATNNLNWTTLASLATSERTATLQDASGTIAFTSDIPSYTNYWQKPGSIILPATTNDQLSVSTNTGTAITGSNSGSGGVGVNGISSSGVGGLFSSSSSGNAGAQIRNTGGYDIIQFLGNSSQVGKVAQDGTFSSTPQGTLYGTATGSITSSQLATSLTDETGTGSAVFATNPTLTTPNIGVATADKTLFTGSQTFGSSLTNSGQIYRGSSTGLTLAGAGSTSDFLVTNKNGSNVISIATGGTVVKFDSYGAGTLTTDASGNITATSDERMKNISGFYTTGLSALKLIKPITYKWKSATKLDTKEFYTGFSAQNIHQNIPQAAGKMSNGDLTIQDRPIMATMVNAINELHEIIKKQDARILELEKLYLELKK